MSHVSARQGGARLRAVLALLPVSMLFAAAPAVAADSTPPAVPTGLTASSVSTGVKLDWKDNTDRDLHSYEIYRRVPGGSWDKPIARDRKVSDYIDTAAVAGSAREYRVRARDTSGNRSNPGPAVRITYVKPTTTAPAPTPTPTPTPPAPTPTPTPDPAPAPAPSGSEYGPARASERDCNGATTSISAANDTRYIDCPGVSVPDNAQRITIVGSKMPTTQLKGVKDIYIGGRPGALMNAGPRSDGHDLLQIKRWPISTGTIPDGITLRWIRFHDVTRPGSEHPDGIQVMAGRNGKILDCVFERVDIQPIFFRFAGDPAGGGPIEDWTVERTHVEKAPNGYFAIRISGNSDSLVPTRINLRDLTLTGNVSVDRKAYNAGFTSSNLTGGKVVING